MWLGHEAVMRPKYDNAVKIGAHDRKLNIGSRSDSKPQRLNIAKSPVAAWKGSLHRIEW